MSASVVRLKPLFYVHLHDSNTNITTLLKGPATYTVPQHQTLVTPEPQPFVVVPPGFYAFIDDPVELNTAGEIVLDKHGQSKNRLGEREVRLHQLPFAPPSRLPHTQECESKRDR